MNLFRWIFSNRFCCGWLSSASASFTYVLVNNIWIGLPITAVFYILFRYIAFKYLPE